MKKIITILFVLFSLASFSQSTRILKGLDPVTGRGGYIYRDTTIPLPRSLNGYFTAYGTWGSFFDTARAAFTGTTNKITITSGIINIGTDVVTLTGAQTITNKTLTQPIINSSSSTDTATYLALGVSASGVTRRMSIWSFGGGGGGSAAGSTGYAQINGGGGSFAADSNFFWDNTRKGLNIGGPYSASSVISGLGRLNLKAPYDTTLLSFINTSTGNQTAIISNSYGGGVNIDTLKITSINSAISFKQKSGTTLALQSLFLDVNGRVGIGLPNFLNSLASPLSVSGANKGIAYRSSTSTADRMTLFVGNGSGGYVADDNYIENANTDLHFRTNGVDIMTIQYQNHVGIGTNSPAASSALDITGTGKGTLINRGTKSQRDAITSPAQGLLYFVTDGTGYLSWYNSGWQKISSVAD